MNFYKRYMGDFARDTAHLTMMEQGAYDRMLDHYYATKSPLPPEKDALYRIATAMNHAERKAVDKIAEKYFPMGEDGLRHNKRADLEIAKHEAQAEINRAVGKLGGRPKKTESVIDSETDWETETVGESEPNREPNSNPNHSHSQIKEKTLPPPSGAFLKFWASWPRSERKASKGKCQELWQKKDFDLVSDAILSHVEVLKSSDGWRNGYIPAPIVYLRDRRWEGAELSTETFKPDL